MDFNTFLQIPERLLLRKKLPKSFFLKNFDLSTGEKKILSEEISSMQLLANVKPSNSNIPQFRDETYVYEEIQVMSCELNGKHMDSLVAKICNLFHKYIPYPIFLLVEDENGFVVSTCEKRINQSDPNKRTIEADFMSPSISKLYKTDISESFLAMLAFPNLDSSNLLNFYSSYTNAIVQFQAAQLTGVLNKRKGVRKVEEIELLDEIESLQAEVKRKSTVLKKETQLNKKVALNMEIQELRATIETKTNLLAKL